MATTLTKTNILRRAALLLLALILTCATAWAETITTSYVDEYGTQHNNITATVLTGNESTIYEGWYVVNSNISYSNSINCSGNVNLILADGKTMTVSGTISGYNRTLTIYGQIGQSGILTVTNSSDAIFCNQGSIIINGGKVNATGGSSSGCGIKAKYVTINGGTVTANANFGIKVEDNGGNITINGGNVTAYGNWGIYANYGNITLGWSNVSDRIYASRYYVTYGYTINIAEDKCLKDANGNYYFGTVSADNINNKTLQPATQTEYIQYCLGTGNDGSAQHPYTISDANDWNAFCLALQDNDTWNRFSGKIVKLGANISVTSMAGNDNHDFLGTFNGNHKTLTFTASATNNNNYLAPFRNVLGNSDDDHAVIHDLNVVTNITANDCRHMSGLIAVMWGYVDVTNCNVTVDISSTVGTNNPTDLYPSGLASQVVSGAQLTLSGCTVNGTIATDGKYAAGLIGIVQGSASISDCVSSVTINSSTAGDGTHGGLVAVSYPGSTTIEGCLFNGKLLTVGTTDTKNCGGFVGWRNTGTVTISNSLYAPADLDDGETEVKFVETESHPSATFVRNGSAGTNCYYTRPLGTAQGTQRRNVTAGEHVTTCTASPVGNSTDSYTVSEITAYNDGLTCGSNFYYGNTDVVSLTLAHQELEGYDFVGYTATAGTLTGTNTPYTLTMPNENVTINADYTCAAPSGLTVTGLTATTATLIWNGYQDSYNVRYRSSARSGEWTEIVIEATTTMLTGLSSETNYEWQVQGLGCDGNGTSEWSATGTFTTPSCEAPYELTATDLTYTSATLNWNGEQDSYNVCYRTVGASDWQTIGNIAGTTTTLNSLSDNTTYVWLVQGLDCDGHGHNTEWSEVGTFTTLISCIVPSELTATSITTTQATLNWSGYQDSYSVRYRTDNVVADTLLTQGFEGYEPYGPDFPEGWTTNNNDWFVWGCSHSGENSVATQVPDSYLISPALEGSDNANVVITFWYSDSGEETLQLEVDYCYSNSPNYWYPLWSSQGSHTDWTEASIPIENGVWGGGSIQLGFKVSSSNEFAVYLDDITVNSYTGYGEWQTVNNIAATTTTLTGLSSETTYEWQVQGLDCDDQGNTTEWSEAGTFTTLSPCVEPSELTVTSLTTTQATLNWSGVQDSYNVRYHPCILAEGFESGNMPAGWTRTNQYWQVTSGTGYTGSNVLYNNLGAATGNYNAGCFINSSSGSDILITPAMDLSNVASATLYFNFWNTAWGEDIDILNVYYRVDEGEWRLLYTNSEETNDWIPVTVTLEGLAANYQIGFECISHWSFGMGVDDVVVIDNEVWTTKSDVNPFTLTGLTPETSYAWQVQGINATCNGGTTDWSEMGYFTTLAPCDAPYGLTATDLTLTSATLNWSGVQDGYNVKYYAQVFNEDFENGIPSTWTTIDSDGDGHNWLALSEIPTVYSANYGDEDMSVYAHGGSNAAASASYIRGVGSLNANNWLITPQIDLGGMLEFYVARINNDLDSYEVLLSTSGTATTDFTITLKEMAPAPFMSWDRVNIHLDAYEGQQGYIAIHHLSSNGYFLVVDDFSLYHEMPTTTADESPITLTGLTPETPYAWQVQGLNCDGNGGTTEWSEISYFTTQPLPAISYIDENGHEQTLQPNEYTLLTGNETELNDGWYVVMTDIAYTSTINLNDSDVYLILCDGAEMSITSNSNNCIGGDIINSYLTVYSQSLGNNMGKLTVNGSYTTYNAILAYSLTVNGGNISVESTATAISTGEVTINGGNLTATGDSDGIYSFMGITINGGQVTASGGTNEGIRTDGCDITINGGQVTANGGTYGIQTYLGDITLGWKNASDFIYANNYNTYNGTIAIASGKAFIDDEGITYNSGTVNASDINGKTLYPYSADFVYKSVTGYGEGNDKWVLISSPVSGSIAPTAVGNLVGTQISTDPVLYDYDLYRFNQSAANEWENYHQHNTTENPFLLENGKGYLYATKQTKTLVFSGDFKAVTEPVEVPLAYSTDNPDEQMRGWNLVGNPFSTAALIDMPFYRMNETGSALNAYTEDGQVAAMEGVFVYAYDEQQSQAITKATFTPQTRGGEQSTVEALNIMVGPSTGPSTGSGYHSGTLDNAILRFDGGQTLEKFSFREGSTKIYFPQDGKEYAIINAETQTGEIPVNFKAESNGTYTLSFSGDVISSEPDVISSAAKKSIFTYLHLIDNLTGADIGLLTPPACGHPLLEGEVQPAPQYTFTAKTTDYESRFKLVFSTEGDGPSTGSGTFAFIDADGNIIINAGPSTGSGASILQVIDVMGRIIMQEENATRVSTSGMMPGVYVLRLINGENVRTQKIVMR